MYQLEPYDSRIDFNQIGSITLPLFPGYVYSGFKANSKEEVNISSMAYAIQTDKKIAGWYI